MPTHQHPGWQVGCKSPVQKNSPQHKMRADATRLVTVRVTLPFGEPPCPGRAGWLERQPKSECWNMLTDIGRGVE
jgi:hypothetical protein